MNEIAKKISKLAFDFLDAKYGSSPLTKYALDFAESIVNKAIDDGLIDHLINMGALKAPDSE